MNATRRMTETRAQEIIDRVQAEIGDRASLTLHVGNAEHARYAIRLSGIDSREQRSIGREVAEMAGFPDSFHPDPSCPLVWLY